MAEPLTPEAPEEMDFVNGREAWQAGWDAARAAARSNRQDGLPKDYAQVWLDGGDDPSFDQIDGYLYRHFNARAVRRG